MNKTTGSILIIIIISVIIYGTSTITTESPIRNNEIKIQEAGYYQSGSDDVIKTTRYNYGFLGSFKIHEFKYDGCYYLIRSSQDYGTSMMHKESCTNH